MKGSASYSAKPVQSLRTSLHLECPCLPLPAAPPPEPREPEPPDLEGSATVDGPKIWLIAVSRTLWIPVSWEGCCVFFGAFAGLALVYWGKTWAAPRPLRSQRTGRCWCSLRYSQLPRGGCHETT